MTVPSCEPSHSHYPSATLRSTVRYLAILTACAFLPIRAWTAPPPNDTCADALVIPPSGPFPYLTQLVDITEADTAGDPPAPSCEFFSDTSSRSTWYTFTPAVSGAYMISTCSDASTATTVEDTILAVYTSAGGCAGPFEEIAGGCNDDFCGPTGFQSSLFSDLLAGTTYYFVVWQWDDTPPPPGNSSLQLIVDRFFAPENDTCADAFPVELNVSVIGSTVGATDHYRLADDACYQDIKPDEVVADGRDVAYSFTAPESGLYNFRVYNFGVLGDLTVYVVLDCPDGPYPANIDVCLGAANRNPVSTAEAVVRVPLSAAQQVFIIVDEQGLTDGSSFVLEVTAWQSESEPNDTPATAAILRCGLTASVVPGRDIDYFSLGMPPAGSRIFALLDGESANLTDFNMRIIAGTNTVEFDSDNNDASFADSAPNIAGALATGERTYVQIEFNGPSVVGPYYLYATVQPPFEDAVVESEPNDTLPEAGASAGNYFRGTLGGNSPSTDRDVYSFTAEPGELIYLALDADPLRDGTPINARLELLDATGNIISSVNDVSSQSSTVTQPGSLFASVPFSPAESLAYRATAAGTYFARVSIGADAPEPSGAGDYLLSVSLDCGGIPLEPARFLSLEETPEGTVRLRLAGSPGTTYRVQVSGNDFSWSDLGSVMADEEGSMEFEDASDPLPRTRFYRTVTP